MKKSVWYPKFWQKKMAELPVNEDLDAAWQQMNSLLNQHFEIANPKKPPFPKRTLLHHFIPIIKLMIPVVLVIGAAYFTFYQKTELGDGEKVVKQKPLKSPQVIQLPKDLILVDSPGMEVAAGITARKNTWGQETAQPNNSVGSYPTAKIEVPNQTTSSTNTDATLPLKSNGSPSLTEFKVYAISPLISPVNLGNTIGQPALTEIGLRLKFNHVWLAQNNQDPSVKLTTTRSKREQRRMRKAFVKDSRKKAKEVRLLQRANLKPTATKAPKNLQKEIISPKLSFELQGGLMFGQQNISPYLGLQSQWALTNRLLLGAGLRLNQMKFEGEYFHQGYNTVTAGSPFQIVDTRKLTNMVLPLNMSYRINKWISLKAEANLAFAIAKSGGSKVGYVASYLDTVFHTKPIEKALSESSINKMNFNIGGGLRIQFKQFNIDAMYFYQPSPYRVSSNLGSYRRRYTTFNVGVGYQF